VAQDRPLVSPQRDKVCRKSSCGAFGFGIADPTW
jgi:hypothetical protein